MVRMLLAALTAFVISALVGWVLIPILRALHAGQSIKEIGPNWHKNKEGTPTMGGIMFIVAAAAAVLAFGWRDMAQGSWQAVFVLGFALVCGGSLGAVRAGLRPGVRGHRLRGRLCQDPQA